MRVVIVACWNLEDADRRRSLEREGEQLRGASLINAAVWNHQALNQAWERYHERLSEDPHGAIDNGAVIAEALAQLALQPSA